MLLFLWKYWYLVYCLVKEGKSFIYLIFVCFYTVIAYAWVF